MPWFASSKRRWTLVRLLWLMLVALSAPGCGPDPQTLLIGRWREAEWRYEKSDARSLARQSADGAIAPREPVEGLVRHEAESWEFSPDGSLLISKRDGSTVRARWLLKGRGHVLAIRGAEVEGLEVYDVKELSAGELILNYDLGMEVRGIARLRFARWPHDNEAETARDALSALALEGRSTAR